MPCRTGAGCTPRSRKTPILNTPPKDKRHASKTAVRDGYVRVIDPTHPLYQREFEVLSVPHGARAAFMIVRYRGDLTLRLPLQCTSQAGLGKNTIHSKLTVQAVTELLALVKEYELCARRPRKSGAVSRRKRGKNSSKHSTAFSRR
jgi:hypothetical protein